MSHLAEVPLWAAIPIALLVCVGSTLTLLGNIGLLQFHTFYERLHAPTLGTSWGTGGIVLGSMSLFSVLGSRLVVHEILIAIFIVLTTPVTLMLLGRAVLNRDRLGESPDLPPNARYPVGGTGD